MKNLSTIIIAAGCAALIVGCSQKTPEEIEAAKYPMRKPLTKEQQQALDARMAKYSTPPQGSKGRPGKPQ